MAFLAHNLRKGKQVQSWGDHILTRFINSLKYVYKFNTLFQFCDFEIMY